MNEHRHTKSTRRELSRAFDKKLGEKIRAIRLGVGLSQTEVGSRLGVSHQQMQKYETGRDRISAYTVQELALLLGTSITALIDEMPTPSGDIPDIREAMKAAAKVRKITDVTLRRRLMALIEQLAGPEPKGADET